MLAESEKRLLVWMAGGLPGVGQFGPPDVAGRASRWPAWARASGPAARALLLVIPLLALNWFGDSLDGTLARVRNRERPRYGYYVDHVLDAVGLRVLFGGLMLGGHMSLDDRARVPGRLLPGGGRDLARHARARDVPARRS